MPVEKLAHYSIRTEDLDASRRFYTEVLGLKEGYRPPFDFPGIWLYRGGDEAEFGVVHIIGVDEDNAEGLTQYLGEKPNLPSKGTGTLDHIAFLATGLKEMRDRLSRLKIPTNERTVPSLGLHQVFVEDPSGVIVELNYPAAEAPADM